MLLWVTFRNWKELSHNLQLCGMQFISVYGPSIFIWWASRNLRKQINFVISFMSVFLQRSAVSCRSMLSCTGSLCHMFFILFHKRQGWTVWVLLECFIHICVYTGPPSCPSWRLGQHYQLPISWGNPPDSQNHSKTIKRGFAMASTSSLRILWWIPWDPIDLKKFRWCSTSYTISGSAGSLSLSQSQSSSSGYWDLLHP